jgi:hypothetical protein
MTFLTDGNRSSPSTLGNAVRHLYRALHLPEPLIVEARNALEFARICAALAPRTGSRRDLSVLGVCILTPILLLYGALLLAVFQMINSTDRVQNALDLGSLVFGVTIPFWVVTVPTSFNREHHEGRISIAVRLFLVAAILLVATAAAWTVLPEYPIKAALVGLVTSLFVMLGALVGRLLWPAWWRSELGRNLGTKLPLWGARPIGAIVEHRLRSAIADIQQSIPITVGWTELLQTRRENAGNVIQQEGRRNDTLWYELAPVLGRVGTLPPARDIAGLAIAGVDEVALPSVVQAAIAVDRLADAISVFDGVAVVLPAGAPLAYLHDVALPSRNSRAAPDAAVFDWLGYRGPVSLLIGILPVGVAEFLLARYIRRVPDAARRTGAIQAMGTERFMAALRAKPVHEDRFGRLYLVGRSEDPSALVEVTDATVAPDGSRQRYWCSVPPHMATAHEAVAWTFTQTPGTYNPSVET